MVFPAHAGMSLGGYPLRFSSFRFPRACGDEPFFVNELEALGQFSPRMRG